MTLAKSTDHGWMGRGQVRVARLGDSLVLRIEKVTTKSGRLQAPIRTFFRKEYRALGADVRRKYAVSIWIELARANKTFDVDNVAKACLDALTGSVWQDDRQVVRLVVEKLAADRDAITLVARPADAARQNAELEELTARIAELPTP